MLVAAGAIPALLAPFGLRLLVRRPAREIILLRDIIDRRPLYPKIRLRRPIRKGFIFNVLGCTDARRVGSLYISCRLHQRLDTNRPYTTTRTTGWNAQLLLSGCGMIPVFGYSGMVITKRPVLPERYLFAFLFSRARI